MSESVSALTDDATLHPRAGVMDCALGDGVALLDADTGTYFQLNEVGAFVWRSLDGRNVSAIAAAVAESFDTSSNADADIVADVKAVLQDMMENGLVVLGDDGPA